MKTMKTWSILTMAALMMLISVTAFAQAQPELQYFRPNDLNGLNVFETSKDNNVVFDGFKVRVGGDFAIQYQGLNQSNAAGTTLDLVNNFNLPTANLNIDAQLADGVRMHLRTYLSARHHVESWVKGGHIQMDNLDFVADGFLSGLMQYSTIRIGLDEFNYGDAHFRRSDNARAIFNPFVGNFLMDSFSTEVFGEFTYQRSGFIGVFGLTNGKLNQGVTVGGPRRNNEDNAISVFGKLGFDKQINDDLRVRLTGSFYTNQGTTTGSWLYGGDRAGTRYYSIMATADEATDFDGRINPRFSQLTAIQINPFVQFGNLEFFGIYEVANNGDDQGNGSFTQIAGELLYRFGDRSQYYLGGRFNTVAGEMVEGAPAMDGSRTNFGGGWFMTNNMMMKVEYVTQSYDGAGWTGRFAGGEFDGFNIEAVISF